ncbi:hypothetical protein EDC04DRAFT_1790768 [Pisolithus marmoratus]|nr:hypothetical protein EDC04DRAFT_1790768 [Pisolithus marmoratus]
MVSATGFLYLLAHLRKAGSKSTECRQYTCSYVSLCVEADSGFLLLYFDRLEFCQCPAATCRPRLRPSRKKTSNTSTHVSAKPINSLQPLDG